jgi:hypothetical protein
LLFRRHGSRSSVVRSLLDDRGSSDASGRPGTRSSFLS